MRSSAIAIVVLPLMVLTVVPAGGVGLPAGTQFQVVAQAIYADGEGRLYDSGPVRLTLTVEQVGGVLIETGTNSSSATPGDDYYIPMRIVNTGNGIDAFSLSSTSSNGWPTAIVYDDNADGIHQPMEQTVISVAGLIVADGYSPCFARVSVPSNATSNDNIIVTAASNFDPSQTSQAQLTVTIPEPPSVVITAPSSEASFTVTKPTLTLGGTASGGLNITKVEWRTDKGRSGTCTGTTNWIADNVNLSLGANVVTVTATDSSGRTASDTCTVLYVDPNIPVVAITSPTTDSSYETDQPTISLAGTATDDVGVVAVSWSSSSGVSGSCVGTESWTADAIALMVGENTITVTAVDAAGNRGSAQLLVTYSPEQVEQPDTTAPTVVITQPTTGGSYTTNRPVVSLAGTATDDVGVVAVSWSSSSGVSGSCVGTESWTADAIALMVGENTITVTAVDAAGNRGSDEIKIFYDSKAPSVKITKPTAATECARNCDFVILAGTAQDNSTITQIKWHNSITGETGVCRFDGMTWSTPAIHLEPGENHITVCAQDEAGNSGSAEICVTFVENAVPGDGWLGLSMVSLPIIPDETDPKKEIGFSANYWLTYLPESNKYAIYPDRLTWFDPVEATPGRGFWAYFENLASPCGTIPPQDRPAVISLKKGWNLVGTPFINPVKWSLTGFRVRTTDGVVKTLRNASDLVPGYAWGWQQDPQDPRTGSYYLVYDSSITPGVADEMLPWRAYWIKASAACDLIIPPP